MYTEVREQCVVESGLQSGYCWNDKFVAGHQRGGAFIVARSLLRLAQFREGRNRLLYVGRFLATVVMATTPGGDLSAFDVNTCNGCALAGLTRLFPRRGLTVDRSRHTQAPVSNRSVSCTHHTWPSTVRS